MYNYNYNPYNSPYYPQNNGAMPDNLTQLRNAQAMPQAQPQPMQVTPSQPANSIIWVQGETGAKSYPVAPNTTVLLMDSESGRFYLKTADHSGMPLPLRTFEYTEVFANTPNSPTNAPKNDFSVELSNYVTFDQLTEILENKAQEQTKKPTTKKVKEGTDNE